MGKAFLLLLFSAFLLFANANAFSIDPSLNLWTKYTFPTGHYVNIAQISTPYGAGVSVNTIGYPGAFEIYYDFFAVYNERFFVPPSGTVEVRGYFMYNDVTPHLDRKHLDLYLVRSDFSGYLNTTRILNYNSGDEPSVWYYRRIIISNLQAGEEFRLAFGRSDLCDMDRKLEASWAVVDMISCRVLKVPSQYATIQAAITEAIEGDTIEVGGGTYYEHLLVDKDYLKIVGEDRIRTVIDANMQGGSNNAAVYINGSNVLFSGFTVRNCPNVSGITINGENATILENDIANNTVGIRLFASRSKIVKNNIYSNFEGVWMQSNVANSKLYYNNFLNNTRHFYQQPPPQGANSWDNGFAGNFWSNYTGVDTNGDGIGETPHAIDSNNVDYHPLMCPYMYGDVIFDGEINMKDISFVARRFGCTKNDALWSPRADINEDSAIDMKDISIVARKFGKTWS